jgi:hypothetical protein
MPPVSEVQRRAMEAAAHGHSTLGIPAKVGKEFSGADPGGKLPQRAKGSPKSRDEHMARKAAHGTQGAVAGDFGVHRSTVSRAMKRSGFKPMGSAG